jgi:hypothetical protein
MEHDAQPHQGDQHQLREKEIIITGEKVVLAHFP